MEITLANVADLCGILGFFISLFLVGAVIKINRTKNSNKVKVSNSPVSGDYTGRDKSTKG